MSPTRLEEAQAKRETPSSQGARLAFLHALQKGSNNPQCDIVTAFQEARDKSTPGSLQHTLLNEVVVAVTDGQPIGDVVGVYSDVFDSRDQCLIIKAEHEVYLDVVANQLLGVKVTA